MSFHCRANGKAYWLVNKETITAARPDIRERYEAQGFMFSSSYDGSGQHRNISLTLSVLATEYTNNTLIDCRVIGPNYIHYIESDKAYLHVFRDFRKLTTACGRKLGKKNTHLDA